MFECFCYYRSGNSTSKYLVRNVSSMEVHKQYLYQMYNTLETVNAFKSARTWLGNKRSSAAITSELFLFSSSLSDLIKHLVPPLTSSTLGFSTCVSLFSVPLSFRFRHLEPVSSSPGELASCLNGRHACFSFLLADIVQRENYDDRRRTTADVIRIDDWATE